LPKKVAFRSFAPAICHPMFISLALTALTIDAAAGYSGWLYRRVGHPVTWMGRLIGFLDRRWNSPAHPFPLRRLHGVAALLVLLFAGALAGYLIQFVLLSLAGPIFGLLLTAAVASTLIAQRSLDAHVRRVTRALEGAGVEAGRRAVRRIVGRDTQGLDESGISRAALESLAENFSDGVVAPVFWMVVGGLPGALTYKAINTADSMIGHKSERHLAFGWASAKLDDLVNLPASRLAALWIVIAACALPGADPVEAARTAWRDAGQHKSPNAGWPEAALAGALGIRIAGPRSYAGVVTETAWMGDGRADLDLYDIRKGLALYRVACAVQAVVLAVLAAGLFLL
jgi:adenosylcobinamide-phosphate synthase